MRLIRIGVLAAFLAIPYMVGCKEEKATGSGVSKENTMPAGPKNPAGGRKVIKDLPPDD